MKQNHSYSNGQQAKSDAVSRALSAIYEGIFLIDLTDDSYSTIQDVSYVEKMIAGISSAQQALNLAVEKTVFENDIPAMKNFVDLAALPKRMEGKHFVNMEYNGPVSGWLRGSFIEVERNKKGMLTRVLYTYQVIEGEKRKELEDLQEMKDNYARTERKNQVKRESLEADNKMLTADNKTLTADNKMLTADNKTLTADNKMLTADNKTLTDEKKALTDEKEVWTNEKRILTDEKKALTDEKEVWTNEKRILSDEKKVLTDENTELTHAKDAVHSILNSGSYTCIYDEDGKTLLSIKYSDALRKLYGYEDHEDAPDTWDMWSRIIYPEDQAYVERSFNAALQDYSGQTNYDVTYRGVRKDGEVRWYRAASYVIRRADGSPISCYGLVMDIDEQKKAQDKINEALNAAELANEAKTSFLARMSHDIRTPLNGIQGLLEINDQHAEDIVLTGKNRQKAKVAADHLLSLINDVLQLSKMEDPEVVLADEPFNLLEMTEDIFTIIELRAHENGITIERQDDGKLKDYPYVWGSPLHVRQIFINILGNAVKYNKKNGTITVWASSKRTDDAHIVFKVVITDTGIGMSEDFQQHLFEPFAREHEEMTGKRDGTGLGMAIVKRLIDKMGGTIDVQSTKDIGSCFHVEIPFRIAKESDIEERMPDESTCDIRGRHILLVEDNELNMEIAETSLSDAGAEITKAANGRQAVEIFSTCEPGTFDIILMDVMMPVMNGYEATECIRSLDRKDAGTIPIIAMTANAFMEDVEKAKQAGMNEHLSKPLDIKKMLAVIAGYCE